MTLNWPSNHDLLCSSAPLLPCPSAPPPPFMELCPYRRARRARNPLCVPRRRLLYVPGAATSDSPPDCVSASVAALPKNWPLVSAKAGPFWVAPIARLQVAPVRTQFCPRSGESADPDFATCSGTMQQISAWGRETATAPPFAAPDG